MSKKVWQKPEIRELKAGGAEKAPATQNDGAANKS